MIAGFVKRYAKAALPPERGEFTEHEELGRMLAERYRG